MRKRVRELQQHVGTYALLGLLVAVAAGGTLRLAFAAWDAGGHLHPDERYVSTVANDIRWPSSPIGYLDVGRSPLSPYNIQSGRSYVYGLLPLTGSKLAAAALGHDDYDHLYIDARHLSALLDTATIVLVFLVTLALMSERGGRSAGAGAAIAALLYAFTVTAIQHAHFFTVDSWLTFFTVLTFLLTLWALRASNSSSDRRLNWRFAIAGACVGLTVACKIPGALVLAPVAVALGADALLVGASSSPRRAALRLLACSGVTFLSGYVMFRLVSPYDFSSSNWLDPRLNDGFRSVLKEEFRRVNGDFLFPPSYQWLLSTPVWDPLQNLVRWQLGLPLGITALAGIILLILRCVPPIWRQLAARGRNLAPQAAVGSTTGWLMLLVYVLVVFFWIAPRFAHMGRYLVPITPFLAIAASYALMHAFARRPRQLGAVAGLVIVLTAFYAVAFDHVLSRTSTRIAASEWIVQHVSPGSRIANEHWDDSLPVGGRAQSFTLLELPVFEPDDATKLKKLYEVLSQSDYYVLSSPRAWKTIGRLPDRFPLMTRFYHELFEGKLGFARVASFTSQPKLFGTRIDDLSAEEAFWVYDHPPVSIYRRSEPLEWRRFRGVLCPQPNPACTSNGS